MKTPEQIRDMEFQKSTMGGYKQSDVELFLEEVASQIEILMKQKADADRKLQEFSKKAPEASLTTEGIQNVLISAQRVADQITDEAKAEAEKIAAEARLKLTEADIKAAEIIAEAENKAFLLGNTAESEAAKIIAASVEKAEETIAAAKASVELEQKLYDRLKIEISDFKKKALEQFGSVIELVNQLPDDVPFNMERAKTVLSTDFGNPEELLKNAVDEMVSKEKLEAEAKAKAEAEEAAKVENTAEQPPVEEAVPVAAPVDEAEVKAEEDNSEEAFDGDEDEEQLAFTEAVSDVANNAPATFVVEQDEDIKPQGRGHITFSDDDDDDDDEPRMFFRKKKK